VRLDIFYVQPLVGEQKRRISGPKISNGIYALPAVRLGYITVGLVYRSRRMAASWQALHCALVPLLAVCCPMQSIPGLDPEPVSDERHICAIQFASLEPPGRH
jgi:hypothetical protein